MDNETFRNAKAACYTLAHALGRNRTEQSDLVTALHDVEKDGGSNDAMLLRMISVFYDGLAFGNWPWALRKLKK